MFFICHKIIVCNFTQMSVGKVFDKLQIHYKCRNSVYPKSNNILRFPVPDEKVSWNVEWHEYAPISYTSSKILNESWADPELGPKFKPQWNELNGSVNRKSHITKYNIVDGFPLNPIGRTGLVGRGCLGRWGPNHAADPIVTRWKRNSQNSIEFNEVTRKPILQFIAIQRRDCHEWAIPGGMVDPGEAVNTTLKREFMEEALNILEATEDERKKKVKLIDQFFSCGTEIFKGYVDDPRNTDNAWMETVATNFHDENNEYIGKFHLSAGDDALNAKWIDIHSSLALYASHRNIISKVAEMKNCHW